VIQINENNSDIPDMIRMIHDSTYRIVLAITGGGTESIGELLRHGRGSDTMIEAIVPYSKESLDSFIGKEPSRYASIDTARDMAMSAYRHALYLNSMTEKNDHENLIGIGVTCKLARITNERQGRQHEIHFASQSYFKTTSSSLFLKENTSREEQEEIATEFIIENIASLCNPDEKLQYSVLKKKMVKELIKDEAEAELPLAELLLKTLENINSEKDVQPLKIDLGINDSKPRIIFSGSFNPCHAKHIEMAKIAAGKYNEPVNFEISLANVDKPPIDYISLKERINSLLKYREEKYMGNIFLTNSPLFAEKAILFPNSIFLIGTDTLNRLFNEKYYRNGEDKQSLLKHFQKYNIRFMVFRRNNADIDMDMEIPDICDLVPLDRYADDGTSSTMIRKKRREKCSDHVI
jgi:Nicotinic acid mononucleotide adenylyltransferase